MVDDAYGLSTLHFAFTTRLITTISKPMIIGSPNSLWRRYVD